MKNQGTAFARFARKIEVRAAEAKFDKTTTSTVDARYDRIGATQILKEADRDNHQRRCINSKAMRYSSPHQSINF